MYDNVRKSFGCYGVTKSKQGFLIIQWNDRLPCTGELFLLKRTLGIYMLLFRIVWNCLLQNGSLQMQNVKWHCRWSNSETLLAGAPHEFGFWAFVISLLSLVSGCIKFHCIMFPYDMKRLYCFLANPITAECIRLIDLGFQTRIKSKSVK